MTFKQTLALTDAIESDLAFTDIVKIAAIAMLEIPANSLPEKVEPQDHTITIQELKHELEQLLNLSDEEANQKALEHWQLKEQQRYEAFQRHQEYILKCNKTLIKTTNWKPPQTEKHQELKRYIIRHLKQLITQSNYMPTSKPLQTGLQWRNQKVSKVIEHLAFWNSKHNKSNESAKSANLWLEQLRENLDHLYTSDT
jgi:hypothetical protein